MLFPSTKPYSSLFWGILLVSISVLIFIFSTTKHELDDADYYEAFQRNYKIFSPPLPSEVFFANEKLALEKHYIYEGLDRELLVNTYWQSNLILYFKRANRWFPVIEPILKEEGIPDDFKYLAMIESGLLQSISSSGAAGFWQILKPTAIELGLEVNEEVDERYHVEKSTRAACKYFKEAYKRFNNWTLVAASYNMGKNGIANQLKKQYMDNFYDLSINQETARYVFRIIAAKEIHKNPMVYGIHIREKDLYPPINYTLTLIDSSIDDIPAWAIQQKSNFRLVKEANYWLRKQQLSNPTKKIYELKIPIIGYSALLTHQWIEKSRTDTLLDAPANEPNPSNE